MKPQSALVVTVGLFCSLALGIGGSLGQSNSALSSPATKLKVTAHVDYLDATAREPMIVEHPNGTLFVSGYSRTAQTVAKLWMSSDRGATWSAVNVGTEADGALGNSDVDLAMARDGTFYFVILGFDRKTRAGTHVAMGVNTDVGKTWRWTMLSKQPFCDRPWVAIAPDGTAHVIWSEGSGVFHAMSRDRGSTWTTPQKIHLEGGSSHLAVGPKGEIAVRIIPLSAGGSKFVDGVDLLLVSTDGGTTWQKRPPPGQRVWASADGATPRWVEPVAWDAKGDLYLLWSQVSGTWLARSVDQGLTWKSWKVAEPEGDALSYYPYLVARGAGELAATWFSGAGTTLKWQVSKIQVGARGTVEIIKSDQLQSDSWDTGFLVNSSPVRSTAGEYLPVLFLRDGDFVVVSPIQNEQMNRYGFSFWRFKQ
jgi:hypothetical protein